MSVDEDKNEWKCRVCDKINNTSRCVECKIKIEFNDTILHFEYFCNICTDIIKNRVGFDCGHSTFCENVLII